ncbi:MAG: UDP-N-acetylglucosamine 2-epimerase (non-hydrolyzing) [Candidatus Lokiarchaeota archaeon]|nr:UDP-N-acetylglucosamine 2-epimerase (non-hydrolyzing) [Candidatus Lokiarchaeota archaeon]
MIAIIIGTRPEIIKMSPVIKACEKHNLDYFILHTGQHYSYDMDKVFFKDLELPDAKYNLDVGSDSHAKQTAKMMIGIEEILLKEKPEVVLLEGDTNSVLAGAIVAAKLPAKCGHVEAGLRTYDEKGNIKFFHGDSVLPEEINRKLIDHISDYLFAPTEYSKSILLNEGIPEDKILTTGNTIVDAVFQSLEIAKRKSEILNKYNLKPKNYFLVTSHRQEHVDSKINLIGILESLSKISREYSYPVIFPVHPRTARKIEEFKLKVSSEIILIDPVGFLDFLNLEASAKLVLTDSGGVQEESCILGIPSVTFRNVKEKSYVIPETIEVGASVLVNTNPDEVSNAVKMMLNKKADWKNPFGDGTAGEQIVNYIIQQNIL